VAGKQTVWAKRPFRYGDTVLDRGQIFEMPGSPNDAKLLSFGYLEPYDRKAFGDGVQCAECGERFIGEFERRRHGDKHHPIVPLGPDGEEEREERELKMLERIAPVGRPEAAVIA
jgi:hypothetical protein